jgi:hypothetical protein
LTFVNSAARQHLRWIKDPALRSGIVAVSAQAGRQAMDRIRVTQHTSLGAFWFAGWLFTIGFLHLDFWMGVLGLLLWPYFIGSHLAPALS